MPIKQRFPFLVCAEELDTKRFQFAEDTKVIAIDSRETALRRHDDHINLIPAEWLILSTKGYHNSMAMRRMQKTTQGSMKIHL